MTAAVPGGPWRGHDRGEPGYRRVTLALFVAGFATFAQIFDAQAMLPALSAQLDVSASAAALTVSAATMGVAVAVLPWAWAADRLGRARAMRLSIVASALVAFAVPLMPTFETVVAARALLGLALGAVPAVGMAYLTEEIVPRRVPVAAGVFVAGNTLGGICGRLVAGPVSELVSWRAGAGVIAVVGLVLALVFVAVVPPDRGFEPAAARRHPVTTRVLFQLRDPVMLGLYAQGLLLMGAFGAVYNYLGYHLVSPPFSVPAALVPLAFVAYLSGTVASRVSAGMVGRLGGLRVILGGIATMGAGLLLMLTPQLAVVLLGLVVFTVGCFSAHPVASGLTGPSARLGRAQATAIYQLCWLTGTAVFGWLAGLVYADRGWAATIAMVAAMCLASALAAVVGLHLLAGRRPAPPTPSS